MRGIEALQVSSSIPTYTETALVAVSLAHDWSQNASSLVFYSFYRPSVWDSVKVLAEILQVVLIEMRFS